ncbi:AAA-like domain-containing protein [Desmonostoc muscorum LEGE 12446]|uniref:AAA-like domain-containing protein n=1 Tax=Desmonostoc muscorum LEGE 12446 TaxID=1828758 RepID=A0A8J6ZZ66_DESMC|nr:AAA-like domain-containing protein [Desmonostoc muscorum]MCF2144871.1 AAA-like domain-containing protein [Desmonostoc muscorum LEGE 12446]
MARSVILRKDKQEKVLQRLHGDFFSQQDFAEDLGIAASTVSNFVNLKPVDRRYFIQICEKLSLDWRDFAVSPNQLNLNDNAKSEESTQLISNQIFNLQNLSSHTTLEYPEGQMEVNSPFYIERPPIDVRCYEEISKPGSLIRIKAPRQMGKSSLLARILYRAEQQGDETVYLSLQVAAQKCFSDSDTFLKWFCASVTRALNLTLKLDNYWDLAQIMGGNLCCQDYFERYLLPEINKPITLGLDEVDRVFEYPEIFGDFFGLLRVLHEEGKQRPIWKKLRLVIVHSTEVYVPINLNQSPFNVGLPVELPEFTPEQVQNLALLHKLNWSEKEVLQLMFMVGGHPFLVRLALYHVASQDITLTQLLQTAPTTTGIYSNYLRRIESILEQYPELEAAMKEVIRTKQQTQLNKKIRSKLKALGLVKIQGEEVVPSCELYQQYFSK